METLYGVDTGRKSDSALIAAAKSGEAAAIEELVGRHKGKVFATALRITKNREDAEDVSQECFHKAFLHLAAFQERAQFSTWLTRIAMNEALMLVRRRHGILEVLPDHSEEGAKTVTESFIDQRPDPEESCWRRERAQLLTEAINQLAPKTRVTLFLRDIEERSIEETAQILETSVTAVKARVFNGRRKLRRTVKPSLLWQVYSSERGHRSAAGR
jgi:RNA polymerase sigma-70 factor (ECF subfamily)